MIIKIAAVIMGVIALLMTYRVDWVLKTFFHKEEPEQKEKLRVKYIALGIAITAFLIVMMADRL